jgi:putative membrane protein
MPSEPALPEPSDARRLHPSSLLFSVGAQAKSLLLPGIVVLVLASRGGTGQAWYMLLFIPAVIGALIQFWSYRYRFDRDEMVVRHGIIFRNERHIPYARIQNIDLVQNPLHRMFGVAEVRLETAGGQKPEAVMRVLSLEAVHQMRTRVFGGRGETSAADGTEPASVPVASEDVGAETLSSMSARDVFLFGLISNKGAVVVAAALGAMWQFDLFEDWWESLDAESIERYRSWLPEGSPLSAVLTGLIGLVALVVLMRVLSVAWAVAKFHGFRLTRRGDDLRAVYGLLPRVSKTIPRHRIQVVTTREGLLHRWCGRMAVQVETAGGGGEGEGPSADRLWIAPLARKERVEGLLREALPEVDLDALRWQSLAPGARRRRFRMMLILAVLATIPGLLSLGAWGFVPLVLVPVGWVHATLFVRHTAWAVAPGAMFYRRGWWVRRLSVARFSKIQSLKLDTSPFDRRHGMASVAVDTAGSKGAGHSIDVPYLDAAVAARLADQLYGEAGRTAFRW